MLILNERTWILQNNGPNMQFILWFINVLNTKQRCEKLDGLRRTEDDTDTTETYAYNIYSSINMWFFRSGQMDIGFVFNFYDILMTLWYVSQMKTWCYQSFGKNFSHVRAQYFVEITWTLFRKIYHNRRIFLIVAKRRDIFLLPMTTK